MPRELDEDEILKTAIQVANDLIPFDGHRVFWCSPHGDVERAWNYREGQFPPDRVASERAWAGPLFTAIGGAEDGGITRAHYKGCNACAASIAGRDGRKCHIVLYRKQKEYDPSEIRVLEQVAWLLRGALDDPQVAKLMERLNLMFLRRRTLIQSSELETILNEHLMKAGFVFHPEVFDRTEARNHGVSDDRIRLSALLVSPNQTLLRLAASYASSAEDSWPPASSSRGVFRINGESIAARIHKAPDGESFVADDYPTGEHGLFFEDSRSLISAPILAPQDELSGWLSLPPRLGILTIETTKPGAYDRNLKAAFSLLAAHAAWPIGRAILREESRRKQLEVRRVARTLDRLQKCTTWRGILKTLSNAFAALDYQRGLFCRVDHRAQVVKGIQGSSWGDDRMEILCRRTFRDFVDDSGDCQVIVAQTGRRQILLDPINDTRAHPEAAKDAELKSFAVFPMTDAHGRVLFTVHIERKDTAPIGRIDVELVTQLCEAAMRSREQLQHGQHQRVWIERVMTSPFHTQDDLFTEFARFVAEETKIGSRCRIFRVGGDGSQIGLCQAGIEPVDSFRGLLLERPTPFNDKLKPVLLYRAGGRSGCRSGAELDVREVTEVPQERELKKEDLDEWLEIPVLLGDVPVAKVVVDHKNRQPSKFTLTEVRLLATLVRVLSLEAETIDKFQLQEELARVGLNASVFRHRVNQCVHHVLSVPGEAQAITSRLEVVTHSLNELDQLYKGRIRPTTIQAHLQFTEQHVRSYLGTIQLRLPGRSWDDPVPGDHCSLSMILVTLVTNAIRSVEDALRDKARYPDARPAIQIAVRRLRRVKKIRIAVSDWGIGAPEHVRASFRKPPHILPDARGQGTGLAYARWQAAHAGWTLDLVKDRYPTCFELLIPS